VPDLLMLTIALVSCLIGLGWFALAMDVHWKQVRGHHSLKASAQRSLRVLGTVALGISLLLCLQVNHPTMAALVWIMALATSAMIVAFTLAWRPRWLAPLVLWLR
jgi:hypothetical protein